MRELASMDVKCTDSAQVVSLRIGGYVSCLFDDWSLGTRSLAALLDGEVTRTSCPSSLLFGKEPDRGSSKREDYKGQPCAAGAG